MTARSYARAKGLTQNQLSAVDLILTGCNDTQTAQHLGIARETVSRWRLYDPGFQAALNARRAEL